MNGVGEDEVTVTSGLHAQAERTNKQTEERGLHRNFGATRTSRKNKRRWFVLKTPRCNTDMRGGDIEVTVTSERRAARTRI